MKLNTRNRYYMKSSIVVKVNARKYKDAECDENDL